VPLAARAPLASDLGITHECPRQCFCTGGGFALSGIKRLHLPTVAGRLLRHLAEANLSLQRKVVYVILAALREQASPLPVLVSDARLSRS
jgi:hypothetical protein